MIIAILAGLCAVLILFIFTVMEAMPLALIDQRQFWKKAVPLFLIVAVVSYILTLR